jgi:hypothetical protein
MLTLCTLSSIPDLADGIRNKLSIKKKNLQPKREDTGT